jgi:prevent-host-death family protein
MITTITSREFNQNSDLAKKATQQVPVIITDHGRPAHVLLSIEEYRHLTGQAKSMVDLLAMPEDDDIEFEPPRLESTLSKPADLT